VSFSFVPSLCHMAFAHAPLAAQAPQSTIDTKAIDDAVALTQTLSQWAFLIIGGSVLMLVGTSYYRPAGWATRWVYLLFVPGWGFLGYSIYQGTLAQQAVLGHYLNLGVTANGFVSVLGLNIGAQIKAMQHGLAVLGFWLLVYLCWWVFGRWQNPANAR
jgi:hypothetical protein